MDAVTKTYRPSGRRKVTGLDSVTLNVEPGQFKVVRGPSGSGKTTLLLAAGGLQAPDSGLVEVCSEDIYRLSPEKRAVFRAGQIGFVFQQFHLIPFLNVLDNVLAPTLAIPDKKAESRARCLIDFFGLSHRIDHPPSELSVGERQRTALARALLNEPKLVLADEPTGNLDEKNAAVVLKHLRDFAHQGGAVLLATHDTRIESDEKFEISEGVVSES